MSITAFEPVKQLLITPALEVVSGRLSVSEVHQKYRGQTQICPHCLQQWILRTSNLDVVDSILSEQKLQEYSMQWLTVTGELDARLGLSDRLREGVTGLPEELWVKFRRGSMQRRETEKRLGAAAEADKADGVPSRWMHWAHVAVKGEAGIEKRPCHDPGNINHEVAIGSIALALQAAIPNAKAFRGKAFWINSSKDVKRLPDLVLKVDDQIARVLEIQRSVLSQDDFIQRTNHLLTLSPNVEWYFFKSCYDKMKEQRVWLSSMGLRYFTISFDYSTMRLTYTEGLPPQSRERKQQTAGPGNQSNCRYRDPTETVIPQKPIVEPSLPLSVVGPAEFRARSDRPQAPPLAVPEPVRRDFPAWQCSLKDKVEVFILGRWRKGTVCHKTTEGKPEVKLDQHVKGQSYFTPSEFAQLRPVQKQPEQATVPSNGGQLDLFSCL